MYFLLAIFGLILFCQGLNGIYHRWKSNKWLPTEGTIIKSDTSPVMTAYGYSGKVYPVLKYEYKVNGDEYCSSRIFSSGMSSWNYKANNVLNDLQLDNEKVTVFYDPKHPNKSCLKKDNYFILLLFMAIGLSIGLIGAYYGYIEIVCQ